MHSTPSKPAQKTEIFKALPEIWQLIRPRRALLALGLGLMVINRVSGLVLPASTKYLVDDVIGKRHFKLLYPLGRSGAAGDAYSGIDLICADRKRSPKPRRSSSRSCAVGCRSMWAGSRSPTTTPTKPACWCRAS